MCTHAGVGLCSQGTGTGGEGTASRCTRGGLDWISGKISPLAQLPRAVVEFPSLEGFKSREDVALGDMGQWWPWQCWAMVGLDVLGGNS